MNSPVLSHPLLRWLVLLCAAFSFHPFARAVDYTKPPTIWAFNMSGSNKINLGEPVDFNWSVSNNTEEITLVPGPGVVTGTTWARVQPTETTTYTLTARNRAGAVTKTRTITVVVPPQITSITATPDALLAGQSAKLQWTAPGATYYYLAASTGSDPGRVWGTSATVRPSVTTVYTLTAYNSAGSTSRTFTLPVTPVGAKPIISAFAATPAQVVAGGSVQLAWDVADARSLSLAPDVGAVTGNTVTLTPTASTTYTLSATNPAGTTTRTVGVTVVPRPPVIESFFATPATITRGSSGSLGWSVVGADSLAIAADVGASPGAVTGANVAVSPAVTTTYTLTATNAGGSVSRSVQLEVVAPPARIAAFTATPATIDAGGATLLGWSVSDAEIISISPGVGQVAGDSIAVSPAASTTYVLTVSNASGSESREVRVTVNVPPPVVSAFAATPAAIDAGASATLGWSVSGADRITIEPGLGEVNGGSATVTPVQTTTYTLTATNAGGSVTRSATLTVNAPEPLPEIAAFTAAPATIEQGGSSVLDWQVTGAATLSINASRGVSPGPVTGHTLTVSPIETTTYTLTAANRAGATVTRSVTVTVTAPVPVINSFTATPASISAGTSSTLVWSVTGATQLAVTADVGAAPGNVTGVNAVVSPAATTVYTLTARNAAGVAATASVTVAVTAAPPTIEIRSFTASSELIQPGEEVTLTWETVNAQSLWLSASRGGDIGDMRGRTSVVVRPTATTRYALNAYHSTYGSTAKSVTVNVGPAPVPVVNFFRATPGTISLGHPTTLEWSVDLATELTVTADVGPSPGAVTGTSVAVTPAEDTIYTLRASNQYGVVTREVPVVVTGPSAPVIGSFTANPAFIQAGASSLLTWTVSGADTLSVSADHGAAPGAVTGTSVSVTPAVSTVYTLTATNAIGTTTMSVPVTLYTPGDGAVSHPRIWLTPARVSQLAQRAAANDAAWVALRDACDAWAALPVRWPDESPASGHIHGGYQYFDYYRPVAELALGFQVAQHVDPVRAGRYAAKAREIVLKMSDPVRHGRESTDSGWSIRAYVPALALGYDWLYPTLSDSERAQIYTEINRWVTWFDANGLSNDFGVGNYFAGYYAAKALGALATEGENPQAAAMWDDWLNSLHFGLTAPYHAAWLSGGSATDGWNYGPNETLNMVRPLVAALTAKGLDLINHPTQPFAYPNGHARWMAHFTWPDLTAVADRGFLYASTNPTPATAAWATHYAGLLRMANGAAAPVAQRYALDLRARAGSDRAEPWVEFLFHDPAAPAEDYRTALSYRTHGDGQVAMRQSWAADTVWATFQAGPYTGSPESAEMFYDQGSLAIQRGNVRFVVNAWGEMLRHSPGTTDGEDRDATGERPFNQLYTELYGDSVDGYRQARRLFNTFYSYRTIRNGAIVGFFSQIGVGPAEAQTTLSRFEEGGRHVFMRATRLEDLYWDPEPILEWERSVVYLRPQVFVVYDRTRMSAAGIDNWMAWNVANGPELVSSTPAAAVYDVVDRRAAFGGQLYRGRMTALLPTGRVVTPVNLFNRSKVHRMEIRPGTPAADTTWLTVFDAAAGAATAGTAATLSAAAGNVLAGDFEGAHVTSADGRAAAVLFSRTGQPAAAGLTFAIPVAATYCIVHDLPPGAAFAVVVTREADRLLLQLTPGGDRTVSPQGVLAFDVLAPDAP